MTTDDSMNWKKEVFCVNLNAEDRILNFKILESSVFFMKSVDLMIESHHRMLHPLFNLQSGPP